MSARHRPGGRGPAAMLLAALVVAACSLGRPGETAGPSAGPTVKPADWPFSGTLADGSEFRLAGRIADKVRAREEVAFVASYPSGVPPAFGDQFAAGYATGLAAGAASYPMKGTLAGPEGSAAGGAAGQVAQVDALLESGSIDCLAIRPASADGFAPVVNRILASGIPVFTVGVAAGGNELATLAEDAEAEAALAAEALVAWAKEADIKLRTFAVSAAEPESEAARARLGAFRRAIQEAIPKASFLTTEEDPIATTWDPGQARQAYAAFIADHPKVQLLLSADSGAPAAARAIADAGLGDKAFAAGWSVDMDQLQAIEAGGQVLAIDAGWSDQGAFGAEACAGLFAAGVLPTASLEPTLVTKANVATARERLEALLGS